MMRSYDPMSSTPETVKAEAGIGRFDRHLVRGIAWTGGVKWLSQVVAWAATIVVARLLTPSDYGLLGMAAVYLGLITLLSDFGLGAAVVAAKELGRDQLRQLNTFSLLVSGACFAASVAI